MADAAEAVLAGLDPEQREVALATRGPVCVLAGAGTGKTRAIAHRIGYAVLSGAISPARVLAVTFTTRAAGELRGRLRELGRLAGPGTGMEQVQARTFHAAALRQLSYFWPQAVGGPPPRVLDSKVGLLAEAARRLRLRASAADLRDAATEIEWAKVTQVRPGDYAQESEKYGRTQPFGADVCARLYAIYEELRAERGLVDFESVLELTAAILTEHPAAAEAVRSRYRFFTVDEYQDVSPLQKLLLDAWLGGRQEICVVGDPRQTIYSFTGATPSYLTGFTAEFPDASVISLVRNYRSTPQVIRLANRIGGSGGPPLQARRPAGPEPELHEYDDELAEAAAVAARAAALVKAGTAAAEIAILVRTNAQTVAFEQALGQAGVPFVVRGAERFFERPEIRQAVGLIRAAARSAPGDSPLDVVRAVLSGLGHSAEPPGGRGQARDRWESLEALAQLAGQFVAASPGATPADLADELTLRGSLGHAPVLSGVTLASLHAAKGLEWDVVFLPGLVDGTLPIIYAQTEEAIEEERRLLYVGVTRARDQVYLSWALARSPGGRRNRKPSRFLGQLGSGDGWGAAGGPARWRGVLGGWEGRPAGREGRAAGRAREGRPASRAGEAAAEDDPLFALLREWRLAEAREQSVPAFVIFSDATLRAIAHRQPATFAELAAIPGVGAIKLDRYGSAVLALCAQPG